MLLAIGGLMMITSNVSAGPVETGVEGDSTFAKFGTNRVHYVVLGKGDQTVVFVHGWSCNLSFWREQFPPLHTRARLIAIDLPGHGGSDKPHVDYTMDYFADGVLAVMKDAGVSRATLVGHSMGTPVICRVYARDPGKVAGLVAVDGLLRRPKMTGDQGAKFSAAYHTPEYLDHLRRFVDSTFPNPGTEALRDRVYKEMSTTPQYVMSSAMDVMFGADTPDWGPQKVAVPVLSINTTSPMWTPEYKEFVSSLSDKTYYQSVDGAGHFLMLEKPAEFNKALTEGLVKFGLIEK
jgi:pimeloyl-ACP methyl ester carboxylesterase